MIHKQVSSKGLGTPLSLSVHVNIQLQDYFKLNTDTTTRVFHKTDLLKLSLKFTDGRPAYLETKLIGFYAVHHYTTGAYR